jgi:signal transduction histidine kinase/CheY-like chemotaxis protein
MPDNLTPLNQTDLSWIKASSQIGIGIMMFERSGKLLHASTRALDLLGFETPDQFADHTPFMHFLYDRALDPQGVPQHLQFLLMNETLHEEIFAEFVRGADQMSVYVTIAPFAEDRYLVSVFDLTQLVGFTSDSDLGWQNNVMLQAIEQGTTGMMLFGVDHAEQPIIFVNRAFCEMVGQERASLLGTSWRNVLPDVAGVASGDTYRVVQRHQGEEKRLKVFGCQVTLKNDLGIVMMADITPLHEKEEQVRHMQKLDSLGQLAGGVAHDFNNVLGIIRGYAHVLKGRLASDGRMAQPVEHILSACARGAALSDKLLAFGRKKTQGGGQVRGAVALLQMAAMIKPLLPANIQLKITGDISNQVAALCSEDHFSQILMNLLINARDAMPDGGVITLRAHKVSEDQVRIDVVDTGTGMSPELQARIFEPYFTTKDVGKGTGLGLALVYGLVQQNDGQITVLSVVGQGSTFSVQLPCVMAAPELAPTPERSIVREGTLAGMTAMVVDDEEGLRDSLKMVLEEKGVQVFCAGDGDEALRMQDEFDGKIDVLLSDVRMPNMDGQKLASLWREVRPESRIVMMSGYPDGDVRTDMVDAFLVKPVDYEALLKLIGKLVAPANDQDHAVDTMRSW